MTDEGRFSIGGFETWYGVVGDPAGPDPRQLPVLALHGGPGLPHESLEPLKALTDGGRHYPFAEEGGSFFAALDDFLAHAGRRAGP